MSLRGPPDARAGGRVLRSDRQQSKGATVISPAVPVVDLSTIVVLVAVVASVFGAMLALIGGVRLVGALTERLLPAQGASARRRPRRGCLDT
jgi:hypothetical protein